MERCSLKDASGPLAVAVSGGADSLCLALLLNKWARDQGTHIVALTVDHKLRLNSTAEAEQVEEWMEIQGIPHVILTWEGEKPTSRLQEAARTARYSLLEKWCSDHQITALATAHHADDQVETILQRLAKGSGITGLCGIQATAQRRFLTIVRPLLPIPKESLVETLNYYNQPYIQDPSNDCKKFERVRWRQMTPSLAELGLTTESILRTVERLQQTERDLETITHSFLQTSTCLSPLGYTTIDPYAWKSQWIDIRHRALSRLLRCIGGNTYLAAASSIKKLDEQIHNNTLRGRTLGGCYIFRHQKQIIVAREGRFLPPPIPYQSGMIWDERFQLSGNAPDCIVKPIGTDYARQIASSVDMHPALLQTLPALVDEKGVVLSCPNLPGLSNRRPSIQSIFVPRYPI
jgi:tRNA(Ile)-lysidine synthase